ncbi:MAG: replication restart helicase PriA [Nitrospiraceae bacterium]
MSETTSFSAGQSTAFATGLPLFANVVLPRHLNRFFTYRIPPGLQPRLGMGSRVLVPFGTTRLLGVVVSLFSHLPGEEPACLERSPLTAARLRDILDVQDDTPESRLPADLLALSRLLSERYLAPWGQCLRLILPPTPLRKRSRYVLTDSGRAILDEPARHVRISASGRLVLARLARAPKGLSNGTLQQALRGSFKLTLSSLTRRGFVQTIDSRETRGSNQRAQRDDPSVADAAIRRPIIPPGKSSQPVGSPISETMRHIQAAIADGRHGRFLLQTSAHRRFDYLAQAAEWALSHQRTAVIITPEIARAEALVRRFKARWTDRVGLVHGNLPAHLRIDVWSRIRRGLIRLVVGTRSAIFSPLSSLGLVCIEDEHDPSLKEETEPRYHAREVAALRAQQHGAVLLLLSMHPSLETVHGDENAAIDKQLAGDEHQGGPVSPACSASSPIILPVDLRSQPYDTLLSEPMLTGMQAALNARAGVILFLNRKGFASALWCRECGKSPHCRQCSITLTFYKQAGCLSCHYCGASTPIPDACPSCLAAKLEPVGSGTERVEATIRRLFPGVRIGRLDREVSRLQAEATRRQVLSGEVEMVIGTQMLFREDLPPVGFVGLIHADAGLHLPDFRAGERTFHTLMEAVAMAHPHERGGQVVLQTYLPTHHVLAAVIEQNPALFYDQELVFRRLLAYPPFAHLINLRVTGRHQDRVSQAAHRWATRLREVAGAVRPSRISGSTASIHHEPRGDTVQDVTVLGPVPSAMTQLRGRYRWQILVKSVSAEAARATVRTTMDDLERDRGRAGLKYEIDVDPLSMM